MEELLYESAPLGSKPVKKRKKKAQSQNLSSLWQEEAHTQIKEMTAQEKIEQELDYIEQYFLSYRKPDFKTVDQIQLSNGIDLTELPPPPPKVIVIKDPPKPKSKFSEFMAERSSASMAASQARSRQARLTAGSKPASQPSKPSKPAPSRQRSQEQKQNSLHPSQYVINQNNIAPLPLPMFQPAVSSLQETTQRSERMQAAKILKSGQSPKLLSVPSSLIMNGPSASEDISNPAATGDVYHPRYESLRPQNAATSNDVYQTSQIMPIDPAIRPVMVPARRAHSSSMSLGSIEVDLAQLTDQERYRDMQLRQFKPKLKVLRTGASNTSSSNLLPSRPSLDNNQTYQQSQSSYVKPVERQQSSRVDVYMQGSLDHSQQIQQSPPPNRGDSVYIQRGQGPNLSFGEPSERSNVNTRPTEIFDMAVKDFDLSFPEVPEMSKNTSQKSAISPLPFPPRRAPTNDRKRGN